MTIKSLLTNRDFQGIVIVSAGSYIGSFFSYLLQFFLGRTLSIEDYGTFSTLLALTYILSIPAGVYSTGVTKYVADLAGKADLKKLGYMYKMLVLAGIAFGGVLFLILSLFSSGISQYFKIFNTQLIIIYSLSIALTYLPVVPYAFLQGLLRYRAFAFSNVVSAMIRFLFPVIFLLLGFKLNGVFFGLIATYLTGYFVGYYLVRRNIKDIQNTDTMTEYKKVFIISFPIMIVNFGLIMLNNIDILVVKRLFSALETGYYSGTVTLGKILLFGTSTIAAVMFPRISNAYSKKKDVKKHFMFFLLLQIVIVTAGTLVFNMFPVLLTKLFFGSRFTDSIALLPMFSIFVCIYVLINFLTLFLIAVDKPKVYILLIPAVVIQYLLLSNMSTTLISVIYINIFVALSLLILLFVYSAKALMAINQRESTGIIN